MSECIFCNVSQDKVVQEIQDVFAIRDGFPVTPLHTLIIPKRHEANYFRLTLRELRECELMAWSMQEQIRNEDRTVTGFNIGINVGASAGQTIFHCHIHLIPRRDGDVENPKGGVRHVIPGKGFYFSAASG